MLVLDAYFDESGTHAGSEAVAVAGYLSTPEQWSVFAGEWERALHRWGLDHFHMTDFAVGAGPYGNWSDALRRSRFGRLVGIIKAHVIGSVGFAIPMRMYERALSDKAKRVCGGAYGLAAAACFVDAAKMLDPQFPSARIAYVFEQGARGTGQVLKVFNWNMNDPEQRVKLRLLSLRFEGKDFVPLQAADIVSYELYRYLPVRVGLDSRYPRRELLMLANTGLRSWGLLDEAELKKWSMILDLAEE